MKLKKVEKNNSSNQFVYDRDWLKLIIQAKQYGLSPNDVRKFLKEKSYVKL